MVFECTAPIRVAKEEKMMEITYTRKAMREEGFFVPQLNRADSCRAGCW